MDGYAVSFLEAEWLIVPIQRMITHKSSSELSVTRLELIFLVQLIEGTLSLGELVSDKLDIGIVLDVKILRQISKPKNEIQTVVELAKGSIKVAHLLRRESFLH